MTSDSQVSEEYVKQGLVSGASSIAIDSAGWKTATITYSSRWGTTDSVQVTLANFSATDAVIGGVYVNSVSGGGFTINVHVTTASATTGATAQAYWFATGHI